MGKAWKYGDDVNTDVIFPGRYLDQYDVEFQKAHAMEDLDATFAKGVKKGDVVVAGKNFGCGSSREQAATCLAYSGVQSVIAKGFSRIFFRNAINSGLAVVESKDAPDGISMGDEVEVDLAKGVITNKTTGKQFTAKPLPPFIMGILSDGGLIPNLQKRLGQKK